MSDVIYSPGKGYQDGWNDRNEGKPNMAPVGWGNGTTDSAAYWEEYRIGYAEASNQIIEDARKSIGTMKRDVAKYLAEGAD